MMHAFLPFFLPRATWRSLSSCLLALAMLSGCGDGAGLFGRFLSQGDYSSPRLSEPVAVARPAGPDTPRAPARPGGAAAGTGGATAEGAPPSGQAAAPAAPGAGGALGQTLASLGSPAEPGLWLRTGLVTQAMQGRVMAPDGRVIGVELRPSGSQPSAGSQLSLDGFRALGLPLTKLVRLQVLAL